MIKELVVCEKVGCVRHYVNCEQCLGFGMTRFVEAGNDMLVAMSQDEALKKKAVPCPFCKSDENGVPEP